MLKIPPLPSFSCFFPASFTWLVLALFGMLVAGEGAGDATLGREGLDGGGPAWMGRGGPAVLGRDITLGRDETLDRGVMASRRMYAEWNSEASCSSANENAAIEFLGSDRSLEMQSSDTIESELYYTPVQESYGRTGGPCNT